MKFVGGPSAKQRLGQLARARALSKKQAMTSRSTSRKQRTVSTGLRGVSRTLSVLQALNEQSNATVTELQRSCQLSRPAIYRILDALIAAGFASRGRLPHTYVLTSKVRALSKGYTDDHLIAEIAAPMLDQLQKKVVWPTELATMQGLRMRLRDTTRHLSPMVIDGEVVGRSIPLLTTALGLAYLSGCTPMRRQDILAQLRISSPQSDPYPGDRRVRQTLEAVRLKGYAWRESGIIEGCKYHTSTIAIPLCAGGQVRAALAVTFFSSALSVSEAAARYLGDLQRAGRAIEKRLEKVASRSLGGRAAREA